MASLTVAKAATAATASAGPPSPLPRQKVALPLHVQKLQGALSLDRFIDQVERVFNEAVRESKLRLADLIHKWNVVCHCMCVL